MKSDPKESCFYLNLNTIFPAFCSKSLERSVPLQNIETMLKILFLHLLWVVWKEPFFLYSRYEDTDFELPYSSSLENDRMTKATKLSCDFIVHRGKTLQLCNGRFDPVWMKQCKRYCPRQCCPSVCIFSQSWIIFFS